MNCPPPKTADIQKKKGEKSASPEKNRKRKAMAISQWMMRSLLS